MLKEIKRYNLKIKNKEELISILNRLGFKEGSWLNKYKEKKVMSKMFMLTNDIELHITIDIENCIYDDIEDNLVLDNNFCQPYTPFYESDKLDFRNPFLGKVIKAYNRTMDSLVDIGLLQVNKNEIVFDKLVRDKIIPIIENEGYVCEYHQVEDKDIKSVLFSKLQEEVNEFIEDPCNEELADILEVIDAIKEHFSEIDSDSVADIKEKKKQKKGDFHSLYYLDKAVIGNE